MRVSKSMLQNKIDLINEMTNSPMEYATKTDQGIRCNVGHFHLSQAYGGYCLQRTMNEGGGCQTPIGLGHITGKEICHQLDGFIAALRIIKHA